MSLPLHGSNPAYVYEAFNLLKPHHVIDFSVNTNPFGPPSILKDAWQHLFNFVEDYPDPCGHQLVTLIAEQENLKESSILLGNGGAELISCMARLLSGKRVLIVQPTFSEYEKVCRMNDCDVAFIFLDETWELNASAIIQQLKNTDALFLCHPNNPTGIVYEQEELLKILEACEYYNCLFIIDEAFYDFAIEKTTLSSYLEESRHLVILRSLTKMYAIAGLRLGYVLAQPTVIEKLRRLKPYWSVNALALKAGELCLQDSSIVHRTQAFIAKEYKRLYEQLTNIGFMLSNSRVNFYLLRDPTLSKQDALMKWLLQKDIVPRHTYNFPRLEGDWLRLAIKHEKENDLLLEALQEWRQT